MPAFPRVQEFEPPSRFEMPSVISGFLLLRRLGLDRKGRAELLRATGGLDLDRLERVLRTSEAEYFSRSSATGSYAAIDEDDAEGSYAANDGEWSEGDEESDDWSTDAYLVDDIESSVLEEQLDTELFGYLSQECLDSDDEYQAAVDETHGALVAWKQARRRLDGLRKARGFVPVRGVERAVKRVKKGKGKGKEKKKGQNKGNKGEEIRVESREREKAGKQERRTPKESR